MGADYGTQRIPTPDELRVFLQDHVSARRSYAAYNLLKPPGWKHAEVVINGYGCNAVTTSEGWRQLVEQTIGGEIGKEAKTTKQGTKKVARAANGRTKGVHSHRKRASGNRGR